jgi:hypothetical protein
MAQQPAVQPEQPVTEVVTPAPHTITVDTKTGAKTLRLIEPIKVGGVLTHEITFRRPFARDLRQVFTKANTENCSMQVLLLIMAAKLAMLSDAEIDELCLADAVKAIEVVDSFQQAGPATSSLN